MSSRPTIKDLAETAGVSVATVDRVLNSRSRVREATAQRVLLAADEIGYHAASLLQRRFRETRPRKTVVVLLQRSNDAFYRSIAHEIEQTPQTNGRFALDIRVHFMDEVSPDFIAEILLEKSIEADAVVLVALDHHLINQAIDQLSARGKIVISLLSPLSSPNCSGHIGLDSHRAGRSAAWAISRLSCKAGKVGILLGSHRYRNQEISEISFISYLRELAPDFQLLPSQLNLDDERLAAEATAQLLDDHPDLVAIYNAGGGVDGVIRTLRRERNQRGIVVVCNELTSNNRAALAEGILDMVIATPVDKLVLELIKLLNQALAARPGHRYPPVYLSVELHIPENV
jgi:LacI family transcriptional regulator